MPPAHALEERRLSALTGGVLFCAFSALGAFVSGFLTIVKYRVEVRCDASILGVCQLGGGFDCKGVLDSPWSTVLGMPLSVHATAFYLAGLLLAGRLLYRPDAFLPSARPLLLLLAWAGLVVVVPLATYAAVSIGSVCAACILLYIVNVALFIAAWLVNPEGPIGGLRALLAPAPPRRSAALVGLALVFAAALAVQMAVYLRSAGDGEADARCTSLAP